MNPGIFESLRRFQVVYRNGHQYIYLVDVNNGITVTLTTVPKVAVTHEDRFSAELLAKVASFITGLEFYAREV